jgi:hypothetical protein
MLTKHNCNTPHGRARALTSVIAHAVGPTARWSCPVSVCRSQHILQLPPDMATLPYGMHVSNANPSKPECTVSTGTDTCRLRAHALLACTHSKQTWVLSCPSKHTQTSNSCQDAYHTHPMSKSLSCIRDVSVKYAGTPWYKSSRCLAGV